MTLDRRDGWGDAAASETIAAIILFGLFVTTITVLNVTAVPKAGLAQEEELHQRVLDAMNAIQADAEAAGAPSGTGTTVARSIPLSPSRRVGEDFMSYFTAEPARAAGQIVFQADYANVHLSHYVDGSVTRIMDAGSLTSRLPLGRVTFDPHPVFRHEGVVRLEGGAVITTDSDAETIRFAPPFSVSQNDGVTTVTAKIRLLTGTDVSASGLTSARASLLTLTATLTVPPAANAERVILVVETEHGRAWAEHLDGACDEAGLDDAECDAVLVVDGGAGDLDEVTWTVLGTGSGNDVRLVSGVAAYEVTIT